MDGEVRTLPAVAPEASASVRRLFGLDVVAASIADAVRLLDDRIERRGGLKLAFLNAHAANLAAMRPDFRDALADSLVFNDGIGLDIAARMLTGAAFPDNLNGTDFIPHFLQATRHRLRIYLVGAAPGVAGRTAERLAALAPKHAIVGTEHGFFDAADDAATAARVRAAGADVVLVAMGNPRQELFIQRTFAATGCRLAMGVGGLFDFLAGEKPRAPAVLRRLGLEWAFRLAIEPRRMCRRYLLGNPVFLARVMWARFQKGE